MSNRNIFIITLILGFLPNLIFAATINSITPDRGWASEIVIINGENFGDNKKSVDSGFRYVRVGGFINTKILSWSNSAVKISAPTLQEVTSDITRLNPFWLLAKIPDKASLGLLSFATKLFDTAASPVSSDVDNTIAITVVTPPLQESNQGFFTYAAQPPLMAVAGDFNNLLSITYDSFGEDIVGLLTNPKELVKTIGRETVRGIQEVPLFVRDLFMGQDPSQPLPKNGDVSDQNTTPPQQTINQTATQESQPAQEQPLEIENKKQGWKKYTNQKIGYTIEYPEKWFKLETLNDTTDEYFATSYIDAPLKMEDDGIWLTIRADKPSALYEKVFSEKTGNTFKDSINRITKLGDMTIDGKPTVKFTRETLPEVETEHGYEIVYAIRNGNSIYSIAFLTGDKTTATKNSDTYELVATSFKSITPATKSSDWKTIDKNLFSIKLLKTWNETSSKYKDAFAQAFRFYGNAGEYFEIAIDPIPMGLGASDQVWELGVNTSGDGVVIKNIDTDGISYGNLFDEGESSTSKGNNKLEIDAVAKDDHSQNIPLHGHVYYFFFGNDQKETGVDTEIFKEILNSFRAKKATNQKQVTPIFSGKWSVSWYSNDGQSGTSELEVKQESDKPVFFGTGTQVFKGQTSAFSLTGNVNGEFLTMTQKYKTLNDKVVYKGTINGNEAKGTWTNTLGSSGTWSMTRK